MKNFDELVSARRSIRKYDGRPVESEKIKLLLDSARLAPSACNLQPWRFVIVTKRNLIDTIVEKCMGLAVPNRWAKTAGAIIIACSELEILKHRIGEMVQGVNYHLIDMGIAMEHMALKAVELGLGTCYIGWFSASKIKKLLNLPQGWNIECLLTLGYPAQDLIDLPETPTNRSRKPIEEIAFYNGPNKNNES